MVVALLTLASCGSETTEEGSVFETDMEMSHGILMAASTLSGFLNNESDEESSSSLSSRFGASPLAPSFNGAAERTIGTSNTSAGFPATPIAMFGNATFSTSDTSIYRYPAGSAYEEDFYGELGTRAFMELRQTTDNWGVYQVSLYIYPTLSTSVRYNLEQYRVPADTWDTLVNKTTGLSDPTAFENYKAYYLDYRMETRTVVWTRWVPNSDGTFSTYPADSFTLPSDYTDSAYTFPASVAAEEPTKTTVADTANDYASRSTYTLKYPSFYCSSSSDDDDSDLDEEVTDPSTCTGKKKILICHVPPGNPSNAKTHCVSVKGWENGHNGGRGIHTSDTLGSCDGASPTGCPTLTGEEFYAEVVGSQGTDFYSKAYTTFSRTKSNVTTTDKTVRRYRIKPDLEKTIRAKTVGTLVGGDFNKGYTITEHIRHHDDDKDSQNNFDATFAGTATGLGSVSATTSAGTIEDFLTALDFTLTISMEETAVGSNSLSGTLQYKTGNKTRDYTVTLSQTDGLKLKKKSGGSSLVRGVREESDIFDDVTVDLGIVGSFDAEEGGNITLTTESGTLTGRLGGGFFNGSLTLSDGTTKEVQIGNGWVISP